MSETVRAFRELVENVEVFAARLEAPAVRPEIQVPDVFEDAETERIRVNYWNFILAPELSRRPVYYKQVDGQVFIPLFKSRQDSLARQEVGPVTGFPEKQGLSKTCPRF